LKVYIVLCENEYYESQIEFVCETRRLAEQVRDLMQAAADDGTRPLNEWFYGRYSVEEYEVSFSFNKLKNLNTVMRNFDSSKMPKAWRAKLKPLEGE